MRLLVVELHHLGDAVLSLPFIRAARGAGHEVHVLCRPSSAAIIEWVLPKERIIPWEPAWDRDGAHPATTPPPLTGFDAAVCAWPDLRVHRMMARARIPRRIGFPVSERNFYAPTPAWRRRRLRLGQLAQALLRPLPGGPPLTESVDRNPAYLPAQLGKWRTLAGHLGLEWDERPPWLHPGEAPKPFADFVRSARQQGRKVVLIHPGGRLPTKRWPAERFAELVAELLTGPISARPDVAVIDPPDSPALGPLPVDCLRFSTPLLGDLAGAVASADLVVCNDSLVSHLSASCGTQVVTIFGSGDPDWFAPAGNAGGVVATCACPHRPCVDRCVMPSVVCLESVEAAAVLDKVRAALESGSALR